MTQTSSTIPNTSLETVKFARYNY
uniref:Uncharacterized protein n=1 Tax=Rhizophora mucronata TaxID=61149 RepID=A0A2P2Q237_RHIMU